MFFGFFYCFIFFVKIPIAFQYSFSVWITTFVVQDSVLVASRCILQGPVDRVEFIYPQPTSTYSDKGLTHAVKIV